MTLETARARVRAIALVEWALVAVVLLIGVVTLTAGAPPSPEVALAEPFGLFYRRVLVATIGGRQVPWGVVLVLVAVIVAALQLWPRLRTETRAMGAAYALFMLLTPVLNYAPQVERLKLLPADAVILTNLPVSAVLAAPEYNQFQPWLPVTWPLLLGGLLLLVWLAVVPRRRWPAGVLAAGGLFVVAVLGTGWLTGAHLAARGHANQLAYTYWPGALAASWIVGQVLLAVTVALAAGRDERRARWLGMGLAVLLLLAALASRGLL